MTRYLASLYGRNTLLALRCAKFFKECKEPFTAASIGINPLTMKMLANKGIVRIVSGEKRRSDNEYDVPDTTIQTLRDRYPEQNL